MEPLPRQILDQPMRLTDFHGNVERLPRGHTTGWRVLPFFMFSQAGEGSERIFLENGIDRRAAEGELIVLPAGVRHKVEVVGAYEVRRWIHVNYLLFNNLDLFSLLDVPLLVRGRVGGEIGTVIQRWVAAEARDREHPLRCSARRYETGFALLRLLATVCRPKPDALRQVEQAKVFAPVIQYMHHHFHQPLDRDTLARIACLSPAQFHCAFKKATGSTPVAFLKNIRLRHAQQLLITTDTPVKEIAVRCGNEDPFVFSKFFKRQCGLNPCEYRSRVQRGRP